MKDIIIVICYLLFVICIISFFVFHKKEMFSNNQDEISLFNNMLEDHFQIMRIEILQVFVSLNISMII